MDNSSFANNAFQSEPIAIVGASCRFAGGANSLEEYWAMLRDGVDPIKDIPLDRWDIESYYDPDPSAPNKMYVRQGGFLENVDSFDPLFFGISPREATTLDPQQRVLLEVTWEALENAGIPPNSLMNSLTGVFVGIFNTDFKEIIRRSEQNHDTYCTTGVLSSTAVGRLSYTLGLQGPCLSIDTACSSSLVAIHEACQSLRLHECNLALAGGVNLILTPDLSIDNCKTSMLSVDNRCKTFDASANGFVRGEGCGIIVLKRLKDALDNKDTILAVIKGSAVNQDGHSAGLTVPNSKAQRALIVSALENANLAPSSIDYLETHGTGTKLGDPIEIESLDIFKTGRSQPLLLGSVKSNIGHTDSAAGIASTLKLILSLKNEMIPQNLHFRNLNPRIDLSVIPAKVVTENVPWKKGDRVRRGSVSSFGLGGTNAHLILEEAPVQQFQEPEIKSPLHVVAISSKSPEGLTELIGRYQKMLEETDCKLADLAYTANAGRSHFETRAAFVVSSNEELLHQLKSKDLKIEKISSQSLAALIFSDEISIPFYQELYGTHPRFKSTVDQCQALFSKETNEPLFANGCEQSGTSNSYEIFTIEYALAKLWQSWGIVPDFVLGFGVGEYAAAAFSGILSLEDTVKLLCAREKILKSSDEITKKKEAFKKIAQALIYHAPKIEYVSGMQAQLLEADALKADYWIEHFANNPQVSASIEQLKKEGCHIFLTIGNEIAKPTASDVWLAGQGSWKTLLESLKQFYLLGKKINWQSFEEPYHSKKQIQPTYQFQRQRYWPVIVAPETYKSAHPLLGIETKSSFGTIYEGEIQYKKPDFVKDHKLYDVPIVAGATYLSMIISAANLTSNQNFCHLSDIEFLKPLKLEENTSYRLQTILYPPENNRRRFEISSSLKNSEFDWTLHMRGVLTLDKKDTVSQSSSATLDSLKVKLPNKHSKQDFYSFLKQTGLNLGPHFQWVEDLYTSPNEVLAHLRQPDASEKVADGVYPGLIDSCLHSLIGTLIDRKGQDVSLDIPIGMEQFHLLDIKELPAWIHVTKKETREGSKTQVFNFTLFNQQGRIIGGIANLSVLPAPRETIERSSTAQKIIDTWFYTANWKKQDLHTTSKIPLKGNWIIVGESGALSQELSEMIRSQEGNSFHFIPGSETKQIQPQIFQVNLKDKKETKTLLQSLNHDLAGIIYLSPFSHNANQHVIDYPKTDIAQHFLIFLQALLETTGSPPPLWLLTQGAQAVNKTSPISLEQSMLTGLYKTALLEYPSLTIRHIDFDPKEMSKSLVPLLRNELNQADSDNQIAYRDSVRYVPRLEHSQVSSADPLKVNSQSSYLITGGLGGLGLTIAQWLLEKGAGHLVLVGRKKPSDNVAEWIKQHNKEGKTVIAAQVNIANGEETTALIQKFGKDWPELKGIIHAAGVLEDAPLQKQEWKQVEKVLEPKVLGSLHLHEASQSLNLDFFVLFSSIASTLGAPGQANYAAANAFVDALAYARRQKGLPALSIAWGAWAEVGMAAALSERHKASGIVPMKPKDALTALGIALGLSYEKITIADLDWALLSQKPLAKQAWLHDLMPKKKEPLNRSTLLQSLQDAQPNERTEVLRKYFQTLLNKILGLSDSQTLTDKQDFFESGGMDSLTSLEVGQKIQSDLGPSCQLSSTLVYDHPNIGSLVHFFENEILPKCGLAAEKENSVVSTSPELNPKASPKLKLFCLPNAGGSASMFDSWKKHLPVDVELVKCQYPGREERSNIPFCKTVPELLDNLIAQIKPHLDSPFIIFGHSFGGLLSFELVRELRRRHLPLPQHLYISCFYAPVVFSKKNFDAQVKQFIELGMIPQKILDSPPLLDHFLKMLEADIALASTYSFTAEAPIDVPITAYAGTVDPLVKITDIEPWKMETSKAFDLQVFPGDHFFWQSQLKEFLSRFNQQLIELKLSSQEINSFMRKD